jgi:hypothetical protein
MTTDEAPLIRDKWPYLAAELASALRAAGEIDLAEQVETLPVLEQCDCDDDFCQSFSTAPETVGAYGPSHRNIDLSPCGPGYLILDIDNEAIMLIEVLYRPPLT